MSFPTVRLRRLRMSEPLRRMVREARLCTDRLIQPFFVTHGEGVRKPIQSMPGVFNLSIEHLVDEATEAAALGIPAVLLFGIPASKDEVGSEAYADDGIVQQAVRALKRALPELVIATDVCLCEYTSHGHCGLVRDGKVLNDPTLELLSATALSHVKAGADIVAPSDMMDGRVGAIRRALDSEGFSDVPIMSYAVKYASAYYGPFRDAAGSAPRFGDRRSHQMDPANASEALREVELDLKEGADIVIVKPALAYMDIIHRVRDTFRCPTAAYNVSGEYAMMKAAAERGWIDEQRVVLETLTGLIRAGADMIITYYAKEVARWLKED